jgi:hypothetical protein
MGSGGDQGDEEEELITNAQCPIPYSLIPWLKQEADPSIGNFS